MSEEVSDQQRRHSAAHLLARAVQNLFEDVQVDIGPATDEGFYYDFDLPHRLSPEDFPKIEQEIARLIALDEPFVRREVSADEAREILRHAPGVRVVDDPAHNGYPMPLGASGRDDVLAGRIRRDLSRDDNRGLEMFVSGDQLLRGAALNAVEIAEHLVSRNLI